MNALHRIRSALALGMGVAAILLAACATTTSSSVKSVNVTLSGGEEAPAHKAGEIRGQLQP